MGEEIVLFFASPDQDDPAVRGHVSPRRDPGGVRVALRRARPALPQEAIIDEFTPQRSELRKLDRCLLMCDLFEAPSQGVHLLDLRPDLDKTLLHHRGAVSGFAIFGEILLGIFDGRPTGIQLDGQLGRVGHGVILDFDARRTAPDQVEGSHQEMSLPLKQLCTLRSVPVPFDTAQCSPEPGDLPVQEHLEFPFLPISFPPFPLGLVEGLYGLAKGGKRTRPLGRNMAQHDRREVQRVTPLIEDKVRAVLNPGRIFVQRTRRGPQRATSLLVQLVHPEIRSEAGRVTDLSSDQCVRARERPGQRVSDGTPSGRGEMVDEVIERASSGDRSRRRRRRNVWNAGQDLTDAALLRGNLSCRSHDDASPLVEKNDVAVSPRQLYDQR